MNQPATMGNNISRVIAEQKNYSNLIDQLANLGGSELNSLLLEVFRQKAQKQKPAELLRLFERNRFVSPSSVETIPFKEFELRCLTSAVSGGFRPLMLSPLTALGTCSSVGFVDQNNVMSALRGTEVVSDATNVFALLIASEFKKTKNPPTVKYCTAQRHVRTQGLSNPAFTPHFGIFCMASGGLDTGNFTFELQQIVDHITVHLLIFTHELPGKKLIVRIFFKGENDNFQERLKQALKTFDQKVTVHLEQQSNAGDYYRLVRFKFFVEHNGEEINLSDGGLVDWTQKLIPNKKHRLIISGIGTELVYKMKHGQF